MAAFSLTVETPLGTKKFTMNNPPGQSAEGAKAEFERQQKLISDSSGLPLMPYGEVVDVRPADAQKDFSKRPVSMTAADPTSLPVQQL